MGRKYVWVYQPQPPKFTAAEKARMLWKLKEIIQQYPKVTQKALRLEMRSNRIYLYELIEQFNPGGAVFAKPLIEGKYLEFPYARITLQDTQGNNCTVDWQRHTNQWITIYTGTLPECIQNIEQDACWF